MLSTNLNLISGDLDEPIHFLFWFAKTQLLRVSMVLRLQKYVVSEHSFRHSDSFGERNVHFKIMSRFSVFFVFEFSANKFLSSSTLLFSFFRFVVVLAGVVTARKHLGVGGSCRLIFLVWKFFSSLFVYGPTGSIMEDIKALSTPSPMYFRDDPALFFAQFESECEIKGIGNQKLPSEVIREVRELIVSAPTEEPFTKLR